MTGSESSTDALPLPEMPYRYAAESAAAAPALSGGSARWSARRTAATAGITVVLVSAGAIGAAVQLPTVPVLTLDPTTRRT
jgi:hypothetical protein